MSYRNSWFGTIDMGTVFDGVYRSVDNGDSWQSLNAGLPIDTYYIIVHALEFAPGSPDTLYAGTDYNGTVWAYSPL